MLKTSLLINDKPIEIPSGWEDVSIGNLLKLMETDEPNQLCSILTGMPMDVVKNIPEPQIEIIISPCQEWIGNGLPEEMKHSMKLPSDIRDMEFARRVNAEFMLKDSKYFSQCVKILAIYLATSSEDEDIEAKLNELMLFPCMEVIAAGGELLKQYQGICEAEAKMPKPNRRSEEIRANIKELDKFGIFAFVDGLAGGDILKHDAIYKQPYSKVMLKSRMNIELSNYQNRLSEILNPKK